MGDARWRKSLEKVASKGSRLTREVRAIATTLGSEGQNLTGTKSLGGK
jgi:hypothetical protein